MNLALFQLLIVKVADGKVDISDEGIEYLTAEEEEG